MLHYAVVFFVIAMAASWFGFGGVAAGAVGIAQTLFVLFTLIAFGSYIADVLRRR